MSPLSADDPKEVIIQAARHLDEIEVPVNQLGIQFAQIGDYEGAAEALKELDEGIADAHGIRVNNCVISGALGIRPNAFVSKDMVDTTLCDPNDPHFTTATVIKILLGAIHHGVSMQSPQAESPVSQSLRL